MDGAAALDRLAHGDVTFAEQWLADSAGDSPWGLVVRAHGHLLGSRIRFGKQPSDCLGALDLKLAPEASAQLLRAVGRQALLTCDRDLMLRVRDSAAELDVDPEGPGSALTALLAAWAHWMGDENEAALTKLAPLTHHPALRRDTAVRSEVVALRALVSLSLERDEDALSDARLASRMARTESVPAAEYLAGWVLARVRRVRGHAHRATRILTSLLAVAPPPWHSLLSLELWIAAGREALAPHCFTGTWGPNFGRALSHAEKGRRPEYREAMNALLLAVGDVEAIRRDLRRLDVLIDPKVAQSVEDVALSEFVDGQSSVAPAGLSCAAQEATISGGGEEPLVWVWARPNATGRRVLAPGRGLVDATRVGTASPGRPELLLALLGLAGPAGRVLEELFHDIYGFRYEVGLHNRLFRVLIHRARASAGEHAKVVRDDGRLILSVTAPVLVPDPRVRSSLADRVLRRIAASPRSGAKEVAESLGVPLRTVQLELKRATEEGVCTTVRDGRHVFYMVEDTTFRDPTQADAMV